MKPEQAEVVKTILKMSTGFGKSACYQCLPLHQKLHPGWNVVVVIPLKALMKDQVRLLRRDQSQLSNLIKLNNTGSYQPSLGEA